MKNFFAMGLKTSLALGLALVAQASTAAVIFSEGESPLIDNKVHAYSDASTPNTGLSVYGITDDENALVKFTGNTQISITGGNGYAQIFDANNTLDWDTLTISMADGSGFTALEFALQFLGVDVSNQNPGTLNITVNLLGGGTAVKSYDDFTNTGNRSFYFSGDAGEVFTSVVLSAAPDRFDQLKQTDISLVVAPPLAVPEPASWAMMIGGFALVGAAARRHRTAISFA